MQTVHSVKVVGLATPSTFVHISFLQHPKRHDCHMWLHRRLQMMLHAPWRVKGACCLSRSRHVADRPTWHTSCSATSRTRPTRPRPAPPRRTRPCVAITAG
jgi:hypothetical protein